MYVTVALLCAGIPMLAQNVAWVKTGEPGRQMKGFHTFGCGDLNGDGYEDIFTVVDGMCGNGARMGVIWFLSGRDGSVLRELVLPGVLPEVVGAASLGDMNGDGVKDYALYWGNLSGVAGVHEIRDGLTDQVLWSFTINNGTMNNIIGDLDVDGDGLPDVVVCGGRNSQTSGELRAYSNSGMLLYQRFGNSGAPAPNISAIGSSLVALGDVDGDGCDEYAMGCWESSGRGAVVIVSGLTGSYLRICYGELPNDGIHLLLSAAGDLDGDGVTDLFAGNNGSPAVLRGVFRAFSSRTGQPLFQWTRTPAQQWGFSMDSRGVDLNGDGVADLVVNDAALFTGTNVNGAIHVYSGRDASELLFWTGQPTAITGVLSLARTLKPPAGQHIGYVVVGNQTSSLVSNGVCAHAGGSMVAYQGLPRSVVTLGPACPGTLSNTPGIGMSSLGSTGVRLHLSSAPANAFAFLLLGVSTSQHAGIALPAAMDPYGLPGCFLQTSIDAIYTGTAGWSGIDLGHLQMDLPLRVRTSTLGGIQLSAQWLVLGFGQEFPGGMSQALRWVH